MQHNHMLCRLPLEFDNWYYTPPVVIWYWELHVKLPKCAGRRSSLGIQWNLSFLDFPLEWQLLASLTAVTKRGDWEPWMPIFSLSFCCVCWFARNLIKVLFVVTMFGCSSSESLLAQSWWSNEQEKMVMDHAQKPIVFFSFVRLATRTYTIAFKQCKSIAPSR
jgi:hypothetical protein